MSTRLCALALLGFFGAAGAALWGGDKDRQKADKDDKESLHGNWKMISGEFDGKKSRLKDEELQKIKLAITDDQYVMRFPPGDAFGSKVETKQSYRFVLNGTKKPKEIDLIDAEGHKVLGIYAVEGAQLTLCLATAGGARPTEFKSERGAKHSLVVFQREKP